MGYVNPILRDHIRNGLVDVVYPVAEQQEVLEN